MNHVDYVEALLEIAPPTGTPKTKSRPLDFEEAEQQLQLPILEDFQRILQIYRSGSFNDFIWLFSPFTKNQYLNLFEQLAIENELLEEDFAVEPGDFELWPSPECLVPWAGTSNGDRIYWRTINGKTQVIVREARTLNFQTFPLSISEFLVNVLIEKIEVNCFPSDFPEDPYFKHTSDE